MSTQQAQIKISLPLPLKEFLESKAKKYGMPIAGYVRHLIMQDVKTLDYPTFQASEATERAYAKAKEEEKKGKLIAVDNVDTFFAKL